MNTPSAMRTADESNRYGVYIDYLEGTRVVVMYAKGLRNEYKSAKGLNPMS